MWIRWIRIRIHNTFFYLHIIGAQPLPDPVLRSGGGEGLPVGEEPGLVEASEGGQQVDEGRELVSRPHVGDEMLHRHRPAAHNRQELLPLQGAFQHKDHSCTTRR
jgi:hypothetical protein